MSIDVVRAGLVIVVLLLGGVVASADAEDETARSAASQPRTEQTQALPDARRFMSITPAALQRRRR